MKEKKGKGKKRGGGDTLLTSSSFLLCDAALLVFLFSCPMQVAMICWTQSRPCCFFRVFSTVVGGWYVFHWFGLGLLVFRYLNSVRTYKCMHIHAIHTNQPYLDPTKPRTSLLSSKH